jgi:hypothetical protein
MEEEGGGRIWEEGLCSIDMGGRKRGGGRKGHMEKKLLNE